ncbi:nuclear transport factor 2 family protein [Propionivibrio sp.]|uniref:nuclear transport factor 2 family protein n=1 Tax=Propionivibrio sp. TaxID=2212460 RepID=UPI003BF41E85
MSNAKTLDSLIAFYENLSPESVTHFPDFYAEDAWFKDPFNEVRGVLPIQRIFTHMFGQVAEPRFKIIERIVDENGALLVWEFYYRVRLWGDGKSQVMRGASHLKFNAEGKVLWHRDYWDAAEELYAKLPVIGWLLRRLKKLMAASQ